MAGDHQILLLLLDRNKYNTIHIPTILDPSISNYYFVNRDYFQAYTIYLKTCFGVLAGKSTKFRILSESVIAIESKMNGCVFAKTHTLIRFYT